MYHNVVRIGRWVIDFLFARESYDIDGVLSCMYDCGASQNTMSSAEELMLRDNDNCGFTYANPYLLRMVVVIGPTTSGAEFLDTFVHEMEHLSAAIAKNLGLRLDGEGPAYISGDTARELASVVCELGCSHCRQEKR